MARTFFAVVAIALSLLLPVSAQALVPALVQPSWAELTPQQKQTLAPLATDWDHFEPWRRKKWLGIAERYPKLSPEEQARTQRRMKEWAKLSPDERNAVRAQYKDVRKASPEQKEVLRQKWQEYRDLPEDEKNRLKAQAAHKKPGSSGSPGKHASPAALIPRPAPPAPGTSVPAAK